MGEPPWYLPSSQKLLGLYDAILEASKSVTLVGCLSWHHFVSYSLLSLERNPSSHSDNLWQGSRSGRSG